jgi:hypothetical protein
MAGTIVPWRLFSVHVHNAAVCVRLRSEHVIRTFSTGWRRSPLASVCPTCRLFAAPGGHSQPCSSHSAAPQAPTGATQARPSLCHDATFTHITIEQGLSDQRVKQPAWMRESKTTTRLAPKCAFRSAAAQRAKARRVCVGAPAPAARALFGVVRWRDTLPYRRSGL